MSDCAFKRSWPAAFLAVSIGCSSTAPAPSPPPADAGPFNLVIANGRVLDPESGLDGTRQLGLREGTIVRISETPLEGNAILDAAGLAVAPGFVDLHVHGQDDENYRIKAMDGVTTALELEAGTEDVDGWYAARAGRSLINFGASSSHIRARAVEFHDKGVLLPSGPATHGLATPEQVDSMKARVRRGLQQGGLGVGMGIRYTPGATRWEIVEMFRVAAEAGAPVFVHVRSFGTREPGSSVESMLEVLAAAAITGAPLHIVHINSMSLESTPETLRLVEEARARGLDVTTEAYPYSAGQTYIESALLDQYENAPDDLYRKLQWVKTGERLTRGTFRKYRKEGGTVILHLNTPEMEARAVTSPLTAIASDGDLHHGKGHPRQAGTFGRVLGYYVRETGALSLMDAVRKMTLMPARRLEATAEGFKKKGRINVGADADLAIFDPARVRDRSTYEAPAVPSEGFVHVLVAGVPVVRDGKVVDGVFPGKGVRGAQRPN